MKLRLFLLSLFIPLLFSGCGEVVEQDKIVIAFKTLGARKSSIDNKGDGEMMRYDTEMFTAKRLRFSKLGVKYIIFPRGNQIYKYTARSSFESPRAESFKLNALDGNVQFDVVFHAHIDTAQKDIREKLVAFVKRYSLLKYSGDNNALGRFMASRFRNILKSVFSEYVSKEKVLDVMRNKKKINDFVLEKMNERFNQYGLKFTLAGISSAVTVDAKQQQRMNEIILQEVDDIILTMKNEKIIPLEQKRRRLINEGTIEAERVLNSKREESARVKSDAWKIRRKSIIDVVGRDNYVKIEKMIQLKKGLKKGAAKITLVPKGSKIILGGNSAKSDQ